MHGSLPSITPAQILAIVGWIVAQLIAYGVLDVRYQQVALSVGATLLAGALKIADAIIRHGRSRALTPVASATVQTQPATTPPPPPAVV